MLDSIRSRILAACIIIVAGSLAINTFLNYSVANKYNNSAIDNTLTALTVSHSVSIAEWVASKTQMIMSLKDSALTADPLAALKQVAAAGGFINVYIGYADKTAIFSNTIPCSLFYPSPDFCRRSRENAGSLISYAVYRYLSS